MKEDKKYPTNLDYDLLGEKFLTMPNFNKGEHTLAEEVKSKVFHCSNERLNAYFKNLKLQNSRIATVGSSGDQVLNAIFYGSKDITLIDANIFTQAYLEYKIAMIKNLDFLTFKNHLGMFSMFNWKTYSLISHDLSVETQQFFDELMLNQDNRGRFYDEGYLTDSLIRNTLFHTPCYEHDSKEENLFYNNGRDYLKLKELLIKNNFKLTFIVEDVKNFHKALTGEFDYIFLSNIYDYVNQYHMKNIINNLYQKLKAGGKIQYHYSFNPPERILTKSKNYSKTKKIIKTYANLITKTAHLIELKQPEGSDESSHCVYFITRPKNANSQDLNI